MKIKLCIVCAAALAAAGCGEGGGTDAGKTKSTITVSVAPATVGTVDVSVDGGKIDVATESVMEGTLVTIEAIGLYGYDLAEWDTNADLDDRDSGFATFVMPAENVTIVAKFGATSAITDDDGIQVGSRVWASRNVAMPGTFATSPEDPGMFYQWDRNTGWSVTDPITAYDVDWNIVADATWPTRDEVGTAWSAENNPCPTGWRPPVLQDIGLLNQQTSQWVAATADSPAGIRYIYGTASVFLPAAGMRNKDTGALEGVGTNGYYWTGEESNKADHKGAFYLQFNSDKNTLEGAPTRTTGYSLRCIKGTLE